VDDPPPPPQLELEEARQRAGVALDQRIERPRRRRQIDRPGSENGAGVDVEALAQRIGHGALATGAGER
jgi:hypothetical protein